MKWLRRLADRYDPPPTDELRDRYPAPAPPPPGYDEIEVTPHAMMRYAERFTDLDATIRAEVGDALMALRCSTDPPTGVLTSPHHQGNLYAWPADKTRVYVLKRDRYDDALINVVTVLYANAQAAA